jgi:transcriptional regulator with XRE-family HTH domain
MILNPNTLSGITSNMLDFTFSTYHEVCKELGNRLRMRRMELNLTQTEVAARAGVSKGTVSNIEKHGQGTLESLVRVLQAMGMLKELQPLFQAKPTSIEQLKHFEDVKERKRVSRKRKA